MAHVRNLVTRIKKLTSLLLVTLLVSSIWSVGVVVIAFTPSSHNGFEIILPRLRPLIGRDVALRMSMANRNVFPIRLSAAASSMANESETLTKSTTFTQTISPTLLQRRLYESHNIPLSDAVVIEDDYCNDEKKEEPINGSEEDVVEVKTLVWEVQAITDDSNDGYTTTKSIQKFYAVTALQMKDKIEMRKLKDLVLEKTTRQGSLKSIRSMQLAPVEVAEKLTGYQSGCMPPICHTDENMDIYVDQSIFNVYANKKDTKALASIGSGIPGKSLLLPLPQFLLVAGVGLDSKSVDDDNAVTADMCNKTLKRAGFVGSIVTTASSIKSESSASVEAIRQDEQNIDGQAIPPTSNDIKMMSGSEIRQLKQDERKQKRELRKDRLKEYRRFKKDDILSKAKLFRTTARKKGRVAEMEELIQEALSVGDFPKLMEIPDEQNPATNIDKNALHICAWRGDFETVVRLIKISNEYYPHLDVVNMISKGPGNYGKTPIFYALTQCREDVVRYLVQEASANLLIVNNKGQTPCSIAQSHMDEETCKLLYETEAKQIAARSPICKHEGEIFANYRSGIHSDRKLYGDLDPRFPIDDDNRYSNEASLRSEQEKAKRRTECAIKKGYDPKVFLSNYMDREDDLSAQIIAYEESVRIAPKESIINGIPTQFLPRSLRPTVRWWNRDDRSLAAANDDTSLGGQITFTQSRPRGRKAHLASMEEEKKERDTTDCNVSRFSHIDIDTLDLISIDDVFDASFDNKSLANESNKVLVNNAESLSFLEQEVHKWILELNRDLECEKDDDEKLLLKYAWGIDCEWKPGPECGEDSPVSTLQLGTRRKAFLIDLQTICQSKDDAIENRLDEILTILFRNPNVSLVGYGVLQDLGKLAASFPQYKCFSEFASVVDLQSISSVVYSSKYDRKAMSSLQKMTAMLLKKRLDKTQQVSDWAHRPLSKEQVSYAMLDAAIIPLLLGALFDGNPVIEGYGGRFFDVHKNLVSTIRYLPVEPCSDGYAYQIAYGSIKSTMGKAFARQSWPTKMKLEPPGPPKLVQVEPIRNGQTSKPMLTKKERAHLRKLGADSEGNIPKRPKSILLKTLTGNLDNLPIPGTSLGYTKESCAFRVVGHELFKTIPEGTYIGFNRRSGVASTSNAWILFANFGGKVYSKFSDNGQKLSFRVNSAAQNPSESALFQDLVSSSLSQGTLEGEESKQILLFARESTRTKYLYCGFCTCVDILPIDEHTSSLILKLEDYRTLIDEKQRTSSDFQNLVRKNSKLN